MWDRWHAGMLLGAEAAKQPQLQKQSVGGEITQGNYLGPASYNQGICRVEDEGGRGGGVLDVCLCLPQLTALRSLQQC